jgi:hypothetical protein
MKNELPSFSLNFFALSILDSHLNYRTTEQILFTHELFIPRNSENCSELGWSRKWLFVLTRNS